MHTSKRIQIKVATTSTKQRAPRKNSKTAPTGKSSLKKTSLARKSQPVVLVTGGTGFLGRHLVAQLIESGARNIRVMATHAPAWITEQGVETIEGSITSADDVARATEGVGTIYHLAGRVSRDERDAHEMFRLHVEGTRLLCEAARKAGTKTIVLASTSGTIAVTEKSDAVPDETHPQPTDIISRWPYYASKAYQERVALENFSGDNRRLVIMNPSLLLGPGDERLSSTKVVLDFLARKIIAVPNGGLSFVDVRDAAAAFIKAAEHGRDRERYLLGAANWSFEKFFGRLERLTKISAPRFTFPSKVATTGASFIHSLYRNWKLAPPVEASAVEMAEYFWYLNSAKAERELSFAPRDPAETLYDTVTYVRENFLGNEAFAG